MGYAKVIGFEEVDVMVSLGRLICNYGCGISMDVNDAAAWSISYLFVNFLRRMTEDTT